MDFNMTGKLHNRFDLELIDTQTGQVKQRATSYNIILDSFFTDLVDDRSLLGSIALGDGTGTPVETRTNLFNKLIDKGAELVKVEKAYPTSYIRKKIVLTTTDCVGKRITEVGFWSGWARAVTHSMLKDSEGNPISILKTATDILTVYATFYMTIGLPNNGEYLLPTPNNNFLIAKVFGEKNYYADVCYGMDGNSEAAEEIIYANWTSRSPGATRQVIPNGAQLSWSDKLLYTELNDRIISCVGFPRIAVWTLPNTDIFPHLSMQNIPIANGDGSTREFKLPIPDIVPESEVIRVNGVALVRGTDYSIAYKNNATKHQDLFVSSNPRNFTASGGEYVTSEGYGTLIGWVKGASPNSKLRGVAGMKSGETVSYDFHKSIRVNTLLIKKGSLSSDSNTYLSIDYSVDGTNWSVLADYNYVYAQDIEADMEVETINARYWRLRNYAGQGNRVQAIYAKQFMSICFGYTTPGLVFVHPPAAGSTIEMDCKIDRPLKNKNWEIDFSVSVKIERG